MLINMSIQHLIKDYILEKCPHYKWVEYSDRLILELTVKDKQTYVHIWPEHLLINIYNDHLFRTTVFQSDFSNPRLFKFIDKHIQ